MEDSQDVSAPVSERLDFILSFVPPTRTAQQKGVRVVHGKPVYFTKPEVQAAKDELLYRLRRMAPLKPFEGPVSLMVSWRFPKGRAHKEGEWRKTRPDTDNLQKLLKDCMTEAGFWLDDAQVVQEFAEKYWTAAPGIRIRVAKITAPKEESIGP